MRIIMGLIGLFGQVEQNVITNISGLSIKPFRRAHYFLSGISSFKD